jgi:hypothetical protein
MFHDILTLKSFKKINTNSTFQEKQIGKIAHAGKKKA